MDTEVVITGAGPNGLMLACELGLAGTRVIVLDRLPQASDEPKANGLLGHVVQALDRRGLFQPLSGSEQEPRPTPYFMFAAMGLDLSLVDDNPIYTLPVPQPRIVQVLARRATKLGAEIRWGHEVTGLAQDVDSVTLEIAGPDGGYRLAASYAVGADGAHSVTRKLAGIGFPGVSYDRETRRSAHVTIPDGWLDPATGRLNVPGQQPIPPFIGYRTEHGSFSFAPFPDKPPLIATSEWDQPTPQEPMSLAEMRASVHRVLCADLPFEPPDGQGPHVLRRLSGGNNRVAERFSAGRVFLIGDAAHVDAAGGQGLNLGMQDAINLGWKLAARVRGTAPEGLLDSYEPERRRAAERVNTYAQAISALVAPGGEVTALREVFGELLADAGTVQRLAELTAGTDVHYDMGGDYVHPLVGKPAPDLRLDTPQGTVRLAQLARTARGLLLDFTEDASVAGALGARHNRLDVVPARADAPPATALLLRPDCYVAWASASPSPDAAELDTLLDSVERWFGAATSGGRQEAEPPRPDTRCGLAGRHG